MSGEGLRVIITGATGMVGEGVMLECLENPAVAEVLIVNRKPQGTVHHKLKECIVPDFLTMENAPVETADYDACFFCAGVSSVGKSEAEYTRITYDTTLHFAEQLARMNPAMVFTYVSGLGTDSTEQGKTMWARVKGRTENALTRVGFRAMYNFRPGFMKATLGQKNLSGYYHLFAWLYPVLRVTLPKMACTLSEVGQAMIHSVTKGYPKTVLEVADIKVLARS